MRSERETEQTKSEDRKTKLTEHYAYADLRNALEKLITPGHSPSFLKSL